MLGIVPAWDLRLTIIKEYVTSSIHVVVFCSVPLAFGCEDITRRLAGTKDTADCSDARIICCVSAVGDIRYEEVIGRGRRE